MTSRERLLMAVRHQEPDRIPLDLASTQVTGISIRAYRALLRALDLPEHEFYTCDAVQQICVPSDEVLERLGVDTRGLWPRTSATDFRDEDDGVYLSHKDEWGLGYRIPKTGGLWYDLVHHPLADKTLTRSLLDDYPWPRGGDPDRFKGLRDHALRFRKAGYAVVLRSVCAGLLEMAIRLRGMENCLVDLILDKTSSGLLLDKILEVKLAYWERALSELGDTVDVLAEGDDFGTQESQLISPDLFRDLIRPRQAELIAFIKSRAPGAFVFFHSCGSVRDFLPDFIEMGIDIINPVHIRARGMEPAGLKKDFGKEIVFWGGGIDTQNTLPRGRPEEVREEVKHNIEALAPGGGFVFNTVHNIQADVPPENILAMVETLHASGKY